MPIIHILSVGCTLGPGEEDSVEAVLLGQNMAGSIRIWREAAAALVDQLIKTQIYTVATAQVCP